MSDYFSHDKLFKEFFKRFLPQTMHLFFPDLAQRLNFDTLDFDDKELTINIPKQLRRVADIVAHVETYEGEAEVIIIHVEVEARDKRSLPWRMFEYYAFLRLLEQKPVLPLAFVLKPNAGGIGLQTYEESLFGQAQLRFAYNQVGLRDLSSEDYMESTPIGAALTVLMRQGERPPAETRLKALNTIVTDSILTRADKLFLIKVMEDYAPTESLPIAGDDVMEELTVLGTTWVDKALEEGRQEGRQDTARQFILDSLTMRFGVVSDEVVTAVSHIDSIDTLTELHRQAVVVESLEAFVSLLS